MPCNSDHMNASGAEKELSAIYGFLDELKTGTLKKDYDSGYDKRAYNKATKEHLDQKTAELCSKLQNTDVTKHSLEMQIWWRDHQKHDCKRLQKEMSEATDREAALSKLTPYERNLLGISEDGTLFRKHPRD